MDDLYFREWPVSIIANGKLLAKQETDHDSFFSAPERDLLALLATLHVQDFTTVDLLVYILLCSSMQSRQTLLLFIFDHQDMLTTMKVKKKGVKWWTLDNLKGEPTQQL